MAFQKDENELGVLWEKTGGKGQYFTGSLEIDGVKQPIVVFKNGNKKNEKAPDWRILKSQPREQKPQDAKPADAGEDINADSIPF